MKTKALLFVANLLAAGMISAVAQSNPNSTNATDIEMQLAWPDGTVYYNGLNDSIIEIFGGTLIYNYGVDWTETGGGTGVLSLTGNHDYQYYWAAGRWPEFGKGYYISLPDGGTNNAGDPGTSNQGTDKTYGSVNFVSSDGSTTYQVNDQGQVALITGGLPGSAGNELYQITGSAVETTYTDQFLDGFDTAIAPERIQIGNLGNLTTAGTNFGFPYGTLWASLPAHKEVPLTPHINGSQYNQANVSAQGYQLVSQCYATTPVNIARTTIGVGEQVLLSFNAALPVQAIWSTTAGSVSPITNASTTLTAPSNAANATVTAIVAGKSVSMTFKVVEPIGIDHAKIVHYYSNSVPSGLIGADSYPYGYAGAGMDINAYISPTNVSFYRVCIMEISGPATNMTGAFTNGAPNHQTGNFWSSPLAYDNHFADTAASPFSGLPPPFALEGFDWVIPSKWQIAGSSITNNFTQWTQSFRLLNSSGNFSISKFGLTVTRTTNNVWTP